MKFKIRFIALMLFSYCANVEAQTPSAYNNLPLTGGQLTGPLTQSVGFSATNQRGVYLNQATNGSASSIVSLNQIVTQTGLARLMVT